MPDNFLFHKVSEKEREEIKREAKRIMDSFSKKLGRIDSKKLKEFLIERKQSDRQEEEGKCDNNFSREIMFENAPNKNDDFIVAEKGSWRE